MQPTKVAQIKGFQNGRSLQQPAHWSSAENAQLASDKVEGTSTVHYIPVLFGPVQYIIRILNIKWTDKHTNKIQN